MPPAPGHLETSLAPLTLSLWDLIGITGKPSAQCRAVWMKRRIYSGTTLEGAGCWARGLLQWFIDPSNRLGLGDRGKSVSV